MKHDSVKRIKHANVDPVVPELFEPLCPCTTDFHKFSSDEILSIDEDACKLFENVLNEVSETFKKIKLIESRL